MRSPYSILVLALRRATPLAGVVFGIVLGQLIMWPLGLVGVVAVPLTAAALELFGLPYAGFRAGLVIAAALALSFWGTLTELPTLPDVSVPLIVEEIPRYPKVGLTTFIGRLDAPLWREQKVFVRAIHLPWRNSSQLQQGNLVWMRGECHPPEYSLNPFSYDAWQIRQGIVLVCKADYLTEPVTKLPSLRTQVREALVHHTYSIAGENEGNGLFLAMTFGFRDQLSEQTERVFKSLGLTHLLVVSGYQISLIFGVLLLGFSRVLFRLKFFVCPRNMAVLPALLASGVYVWLCGSDTATVRAFLAGVCIALQYWLEHRVTFLHRITFALFGISLIFPFAWLDLGVQFTATALLGIGSGLYVSRGNKKHVRFFMVSYHVWLLTSVTMVLWFGTLTLLSLPVNLLVATPWSSFNCTVGTLALALSYLSLPGASFPLYLIGAVNSIMVSLLSYLEYYSRDLILSFESPWKRIGVALFMCALLGIQWWRHLSAIVRSEGKSAEIVIRTSPD